MAVRAVVRHNVDDELDPGAVQCVNHPIELLKRSDPRVDVAVVVNVVPAVRERGRVERTQPDGVDTQGDEVIDPGDDPFQVTHPVAVAIGKAARVDLVDSGLTPPVGVVVDVAGSPVEARSGRHKRNVPLDVLFVGLGFGQALTDPRITPERTQRWAMM